MSGPATAPARLVEDAYRAWNEAGPRAFVEFATDDIEVHDAPELPDAGTWVGRDAVVRRLEELVAATGGRWADIEEVRAVGDQVIVSLTWRFDAASSTLASVHHVVRVEGDRIARVRVFLDRAEAVRAAGG
jgi:ketosteroid isomerase-like protein